MRLLEKKLTERMLQDEEEKGLRLETMIYDKMRKVILEDSVRTVVFAEVEDTCYEIVFYSLFEQKGYKQCYALAEEGVLDGDILQKIFGQMAESIRMDSHYEKEQINVFSFVFDGGGVKMEVEQFGKEMRLHRIKKAWKERYLNA